MKTKLHIFKVVADHLSFTRASERLFISQPAVSKAIKNLEEEYKTAFFVRRRNSIELTANGKVFLEYANRILDLYAQLENRLLYEQNQFPGQITFGASTTLASYILPELIADFRRQNPLTTVRIVSGNSEDIMEDILGQKLDFGITEGKNTNRKLQFRKFFKDEIVLVTNAANTAVKSGVADSALLQTLPLVEREIGSGTREMIYQGLKNHQINSLNVVVTLNSTEAIKNYLYHSDAFALLSINAVAKDLVNNQLKIIDLKDISIERWFYFVSRTGYQSQLMNDFEKYLRNARL